MVGPFENFRVQSELRKSRACASVPVFLENAFCPVNNGLALVCCRIHFSQLEEFQVVNTLDTALQLNLDNMASSLHKYTLPQDRRSINY